MLDSYACDHNYSGFILLFRNVAQSLDQIKQDSSSSCQGCFVRAIWLIYARELSFYKDYMSFSVICYNYLEKILETDLNNYEMDKLCKWLEIKVQVFFPTQMSEDKIYKDHFYNYQFQHKEEREELIKRVSTYLYPHTFGDDKFEMCEKSLVSVNGHFDVMKLSTILQRVLCSTCKHWVTVSDQIMNHWNTCITCPKCNRSTTTNSNHIRVCSGEKPHVKQKNILLEDKYSFKDTDTIHQLTTDNTHARFKAIKFQHFSKQDVTFRSNVHFADFECFVDVNDSLGNFKVYAVGLLSIGIDTTRTRTGRGQYMRGFNYFEDDDSVKNPSIDYGKGALDWFFGRLNDLKGVLFFFNGAQFDVFFIVRHMLIRGMKIDTSKMIINNNRIISLQYHKDLVIRDLMLYLSPCSLRSACKGFGVPEEYAKGDFDHNKINCWEDVDRYEEEVVPYLKNDVLSMFFIYRAYAEEIYNIYDANITTAITLSHMSYLIWTNMMREEFKDTIFIYKLPMSLYRKIIPGYYGGRVLLNQQTAQISSMISLVQDMDDNDGMVSDEYFTNIDQYMVKLDVVSLYPTAARRYEYPCGKFKFVDRESDCKKHVETFHHLQTGRATTKLIACVDVTCPKGIYIPFLMSRNKNGELEQNLEDKINQVYVGVELYHACTHLGYRVTKVYWYLEFERTAPLFRGFMDRFWKVKKEAKKGTSKYATAKGTGNSLTGKCGQIEHETVTRIHTLLEDDDIAVDCIGMEFIRDDNGEIVGLITTEKQEKEYTTYPTYLSLFILAYSRIIMSNYMIKMDSYKDSTCVPLYGDTDSFIVWNHAFAKLPPECLGRELGQLDDEFSGGKAITFIGAAPKTYNQMYIEKNKDYWGRHRLMTITRCKGIPHTAEAKEVNYLATRKKYNSKILDSMKDYLVERKQKTVINESIPIALVGLSGVVYHCKVRNEDNDIVEEYLVDFIGNNEMYAIIQKKLEISVYYKSIRKTVRSRGTQIGVSIFLTLSERRFCATSWWDKGKRRIKPDDINEMSKPVGFSECPIQMRGKDTQNDFLTNIRAAEDIDDLLYESQFI